MNVSESSADKPQLVASGEMAEISESKQRLFRPRFGIGARLIAAMLFICAVDIIAMGIASRVGFDRGFVDYLNERGISKLESLKPIVEGEYARHGSWDFILESPRIWFDLVGLPGDLDGVPPIGTPIPEHVPVDISGTSLRIALLDRERNFIIGQLEDNLSTIELPINVNGEIVGWLTYKPASEVITAADKRFKRRQDSINLVIGIVAMIIAAGLAFFLSVKFVNMLRPIRRAIGDLARGHYNARLSEESNNEIGDLSADVNHLSMVLERNESVRRNLMADVSHELRTPIAVLQAELEAIYDGIQVANKDSIRSLLAEVKILSLLVDDVYEVSSSDAGALSYRFETVDLSDILECAVIAFEERRRKRRIQIEVNGFEDLILIQGDDGRLRQLFNNLIENSMRYTYTDGRLVISCELKANWVEIVFEDSAPGAPEEFLDSLFERSFRAVQRVDNGRRGNGLGLAICKNIVEAHRGKIWASGSNIGGLRVTIMLPRAVG